MFRVNLKAFFKALGITPPNSENTADEAGVVEIKDGTDFANLCRRSGVPADANVTLTFPDVCFLPPAPAGPVPIPYPQAALDSLNNEVRKGGYKKVKILDSSKAPSFSKTAGDEAGAQKGVVSSKNMAKPGFTSFSHDVKFEGTPVVRMTSVTTANTSFR